MQAPHVGVVVSWGVKQINRLGALRLHKYSKQLHSMGRPKTNVKSTAIIERVFVL